MCTLTSSCCIIHVACLLQEELGTLRQQYAADLAAVQQQAQQAMDKDRADTHTALNAMEASKAVCEVNMSCLGYPRITNTWPPTSLAQAARVKAETARRDAHATVREADERRRAAEERARGAMRAQEAAEREAVHLR